MNVYWIGLGVGLALVLVGIIFVARHVGAEGSAEVTLLWGLGIKGASAVLVIFAVGAFGVGASIWKLASSNASAASSSPSGGSRS
jgi:hypothetical protein